MTKGSGKQRSRVLAALDGSGLFQDASDTLTPSVAGTQVLGKRSFENVTAAGPSSSNIREEVQGPGSLLAGKNMRGRFNFCPPVGVALTVFYARRSCRACPLNQHRNFTEAAQWGNEVKAYHIRIFFEI